MQSISEWDRHYRASFHLPKALPSCPAEAAKAKRIEASKQKRGVGRRRMRTWWGAEANAQKKAHFDSCGLSRRRRFFGPGVMAIFGREGRSGEK